MGRSLRVVIDARLESGLSGGLEGVLAGLARGLSELDGQDEYLFAVWPNHDGWLTPYVSRQASLVTVPLDPAYGHYGPRRMLIKAERRLRRTIGIEARFDNQDARVPSRDPVIDRLRPTVVHMLRQRGFLTKSPSIYHPHDLQHIHLPEFFTSEERVWRERVYGALCRQAAMVAVASEWTRRDVVEHYGLPEDKVRVVTLAPPLDAAPPPTREQRDAVRERFGLPPTYLLYPAQTWPHKNHARLLQALAVLRDQSGLAVPLVATGMQNAHFSELATLTDRLGLDGDVVWTGFVAPVDLRAIFAEARAVVVPSLFEAASAPLWEAFLTRVPAACSNVTSLPDQAGEAALIFDPLSVTSIAEAIGTLWIEADVRSRLVVAGAERVAELSWRKTALQFRAHYRRLAGYELSDEDRDLVGIAG